jgi:membrane protein DedA with SNARE-associated domain
MEAVPDTFSFWLIQYGSISLFVLLALGIICLPIPEDTLMIFAGILMHQGYLPISWTFLSACLGSICGITVSYLIGYKMGDFLINKYGKYIGLTESRMLQVHWWFERFGGWFLIIGYFIPGLRHFTGLFAGISAMEFRHFILYAYPGAIVWVTVLLSVGYFFGNCCEQLIEIIEQNLEIFLTSLVVLVSLYFLLKYFFKKK